MNDANKKELLSALLDLTRSLERCTQILVRVLDGESNGPAPPPPHEGTPVQNPDRGESNGPVPPSPHGAQTEAERGESNGPVPPPPR